jgi:hypothetical protein
MAQLNFTLAPDVFVDDDFVSYAWWPPLRFHPSDEVGDDILFSRHDSTALELIFDSEATLAIERRILSGSTNGRPVKVVATATAGTTIHTAHATSIDEVWLWAVNTDTTARKLTVELGGTSSPDDLIEVTIPAEGGLVLVAPGLSVTGSVVVRAFCATANVVNVVGFVNRIS